ncbi:MAG TPA: tRNA (pseudouridine(54)-N(1))-methyltransferase TrmY [Methanoregulaceae archaeon]|nr:tRNA (pseudouridine(54)-N(1))-methyltransferase TrmY [Methanoregulaceae archaeon]
MIRIAVVGHLARSSGDFSINDLPGAAGRMDVLCRCVNSSFFLSHDLRRDVECFLVLCGEPDPPKTIKISGRDVKHLNPDERTTAALLKKALSMVTGTKFRESTPGIFVRRGGLKELAQDFSFSVLDEGGSDIRSESKLPEAYILSDHLNFSPAENEILSGMPACSVGPQLLHADHTISVLFNEIDRRRAGWA